MDKSGGSVFLTDLKDALISDAHSLQINDSDSNGTSTPLAVASSDTGSTSRLESLSKDSRRSRDVESAEVDLVGYQPLPFPVILPAIIDKVGSNGFKRSSKRKVVNSIQLDVDGIVLARMQLRNSGVGGPLYIFQSSKVFIALFAMLPV